MSAQATDVRIETLSDSILFLAKTLFKTIACWHCLIAFDLLCQQEKKTVVSVSTRGGETFVKEYYYKIYDTQRHVWITALSTLALSTLQYISTQFHQGSADSRFFISAL
mmetsp:Transcript_44402/g.74004  ORF Transcript_44402/g.74004 Transcript_44402/m.74004 type:complete len:109 (-) Transcript_44402:530-856(-)